MRCGRWVRYADGTEMFVGVGDPKEIDLPRLQKEDPNIVGVILRSPAAPVCRQTQLTFSEFLRPNPQY